MSTKRSFFKGIAFIGIAKYSGYVITIVITSILARLLTPTDFGVVAVSTVFITFFSLLSDMGIGPAIIQIKQLTKNDIQSIFGFSILVGLFLSLCFCAASPFIASFYEQPILRNVCMLLSLQILFCTLNTVPNALLLKEKKFNVVAYRTVTIQIVCGALSIWAAYEGWGLYALLISPILSALFTLMVNVWYMKLSINVFPKLSSIKKISSFSIYQFLFNFVNYFGRNLDKLIIGKTISVAQLGYYEKSYRLMQMPQSSINGVIDPVLLPYLSESQNDLPRIHSVYKRMTKILFYISLPVSAVLFACSYEIIRSLFGVQWVDAVPCFSILALSIALQIPTVPAGPILQSCNRTKLLFVLGSQNVTIGITSMLIAAFCFRTIEAIAIAFDIGALLVAINTLYTINKKCFAASASYIPPMVVKPLVFSVLMVVVLKIIEYLCPVHFLLMLIVKVFFAAVMTFLFFQYFTDMKPLEYLSKIKNK